MYYCVIWNNNSGIVHESWINSVSHTFRWPKAKRPIISILKGEIPNDNWYTYNYTRISGPFETYDDARAFEVETLDLSTNDDEGFASKMIKKSNKKHEMPKRVHRKPRRYCTATSDEKSQNKKRVTRRKRKIISSSSSENDENGPLNKKIPRPPTNYISQKSIELIPTKYHNQLDNSFTTSSVNASRTPTPDCFRTSSQNFFENDTRGSVPDQEKNIKSENSQKSDDEPDIPSTSASTFDSTEDNKSISILLEELQPENQPLSHAMSSGNKLSKNLNFNHLSEEKISNGTQQAPNQTCCQKVYNDIIQMKRMLSAIYLLLTDKDRVPDLLEEEEIDFNFKIDSTRQLNDFENKLRNESAAAQYTRMMKQLGGDTFDKHVRRALTHTFTDVMAYRMTWTGARNTYRVANRKFTNSIIDAIMQHWPCADRSSIENVIKSWFQHAGDRIK